MELRCEKGQAVTELAIALFAFGITFFAMDFTCSLVMAKNRAAIYQHHLLFKAYRDSEKALTTNAPHPDPQHLHLEGVSGDFQGRIWFEMEPDKLQFTCTFIPHFAREAYQFAKLQAVSQTTVAKLFRDSWEEHPIKYALWATGVGMSVLSTYTAAAAGSGTDGGDAVSAGSSSIQNILSTNTVQFSDVTNILNLGGNVYNAVKDAK